MQYLHGFFIYIAEDKLIYIAEDKQRKGMI